DEWDHSSNGSTGSRPSCGSRPGSGSRSDSRGPNNQLKGPAKNGNREGSLDILGTDIWAANTMDSHGGAGWDVQPEKLDFSQFHRTLYRGTPKHLPHIDREGMMKDKFEADDGIDMNDIERFLPHLHSAFRQTGDGCRLLTDQSGVSPSSRVRPSITGQRVQVELMKMNRTSTASLTRVPEVSVLSSAPVLLDHRGVKRWKISTPLRDEMFDTARICHNFSGLFNHRIP
ncbi:hypothetical protein NHX12_027848, partial [Muraenolepis orangiensis]